jgi:3-deoxy-7-phosphoheptulonate synthase
MLLVDMHPVPKKSLVDAQQAITLEELPYLLEDVAIARDAWEKRRSLARKTQAALSKVA